MIRKNTPYFVCFEHTVIRNVINILDWFVQKAERKTASATVVLDKDVDLEGLVAEMEASSKYRNVVVLSFQRIEKGKLSKKKKNARSKQ